MNHSNRTKFDASYFTTKNSIHEEHQNWNKKGEIVTGVTKYV